MVWLFADRSGTNRTRDRRIASVRVSFRFSFLANAKQKVGSKTCSGLTYLELVLVDIVGLEEVSMAENADCVAGTHKSAHEYLAGGFWDSRSGRCGFGLFRLLGRLSDTAYGAGRSRSSSIGAAASTSATLGLATGLEDVIEAGVELGRHGDAGVVNAKVRRVSEARWVQVDLEGVVVALLMKLLWAWPDEGRVADKGARCLGRSA
jgi:hypothetical protein